MKQQTTITEITTCTCGQKNRVPATFTVKQALRCGRCKRPLAVGAGWAPNPDFTIPTDSPLDGPEDDDADDEA